MTESDPMPPMRERIARVIVLNAPNSSPISPDRSLSIADAVLAEIETPTEGMCRAMAHAWSPELDHEKPLGQDKVFDSYLEDMADGYKAGIRAAREGS